jgi:glycerol-3-phosphate cytidylyltransferase
MKNTRATPKKIGVTFSAFDLCHAGHMMMLKDAKAQCDYLIVGLQDDPSIDNDINNQYRGKPKNRPIMSLEERRTILESVKYVDQIFIYKNEKDLYEWLQKNKYDVRILGSDWEGKKYTGYDLPHKAYFHKRTHNYSTTELRKRVYEAEKNSLQSGTTSVVSWRTETAKQSN